MSSRDPKWHVPFKGRHDSLATRQNFLWQYGNVYVMDNRRAALWCWLREIGVDDKSNVRAGRPRTTATSRISRMRPIRARGHSQAIWRIGLRAPT